MAQSARTGMAIMVAATACFTWSDIAIKVIGAGLSPWQIISGRGLFGLTALLLITRFNVRSLVVRRWPIQFGLGAACALGYTCFVFSLKFLPLSIAMPLGYVYPALGALMSPLINKEAPNKNEWLAIALALAAVILLSQGTEILPGTNIWAGFILGLVGAFFVALMANLARRQTQSIPLKVNLFYLYLANAVICLPFALILDSPTVPPAAELAKLFGLIAPGSVTGFFLMFIAYRSISAFRGATIMMLEAAAAGVVGVAVLGEPLTGFMVAGGGLMMVSAYLITRSNCN